jgi:hypothetical protein
MDGKHWHTGLEHILLYGVSALIVFNLIRIGAARATTSSNRFVSSAGQVAGSLVRF